MAPLYPYVTQPQTYYRDEQDESDVSGIVVVETDGADVRVTENSEDVHWSAPFWMPANEFNAVTHSDEVEEVGLLPDEKFEQVVGVAKGNA